MENKKTIIKKFFSESLSFSKIALANAEKYLSDAYENYNKKVLEKQKQQQLQMQMQMKQNELQTAQQIMIILAQQLAPAFYCHKYDFLEKIYEPSNLRLEDYKYYDNIWLLRYSIDKNCDIPIPQWDKKQLHKKLSQDLARYVQDTLYHNPLEVLQLDYFYILCNPTIYNITDNSPAKKIFVDIRITL